eukprot:Blabericola_migrator_1__8643@NODE_4532_length_1103_cov_539_920849_g2749_i1_p1_GENE_NODE_4532_length_1103_cov_539_920849_g2749_i1NODE_4532_length_1103_cov_539_920849_g2749_i1_p1_ORF_typecomplete_len300_score26_14RRM_1/PF00076_22/1_6e13RRM_1/PF00076_22/3_6e06RRM_1/PF00076_22/5e03RRM_5/PF13893_6/1_2e05RRM_5/PF13893_6/70RRM_3/PF08777_11/8_9RRM_3/PF08777_11/0_00019Limkainb1/PF11608_8/0_0012Limkainb1/PF11608_8/7_4RRM_occluded/PF16842_5/0_033RRM_occluded/PF16842_5/4_6e02Nup35_RRM_2/PF14605_6/0_041Nup35
MSRCYVGALPPDPPEDELSRVFEGAGEIHDVQVKKTISGDWYAFVHYKDPEAADEAIRRFDGYDFHGSRLRVELPFASDKRNSLRRNMRRPYPSSGRITVRVIGIPHSGSWQDLKDHFRGAGDCIFADTYGDGTGIVEYTAYEDAQRAVNMFDNSVFKSHQGESSRIQLEILAPGRASYSSSYRSRPYNDSYRDRSDRPYYRDDRAPPYHSRGGDEYDDDRYDDRRYYSSGRDRSYGPVRYNDRGGERGYGRSSRDLPPSGGSNGRGSSYNNNEGSYQNRSRSRSPGPRRSSRSSNQRI